MAAIKTLLVHGGGWHPFHSCASILKDLYEIGGFAKVTMAERDTAFDQDLSSFDVIVLYTQGGKLTKQQEQRLCKYVRDGGGLVGLHCASDTFTDNAEFMKMIGTKFVTHAPFTVKFDVNVSNAEHALADGFGTFSIVDEFYVLERMSDDLDVFMTAQWQGKPAPMAYTKSYGKGRVFYSANGHDERAFCNGEFQRLACRALTWAAGRFEPVKKNVGVGLLGYGPSFAMGPLHAKYMAQSGGFELVAVCDTNADRRKAAEDDHPGVVTYDNFDPMLDDKEVELVVCILPHNLHAKFVVKALQANRHVIVEKPLCLSVREAEQMMDAARKQKRLLAVFQNRRWDHQFLTARRIVRSGQLGEVFEMQIDLAGYGHPGTWWRSEKKISGGMMFDMGAHCIDWVLHLVPHKIVGISAYYQKRKWLMVTTEDHVRVLLRFENGAVANFCNSMLYAAQGPGWTILGTEGGLHFPNVFDEHGTLTTFPMGAKQTTTVPCEPDDWPAFYRNVRDHLHHGSPLLARPELSARLIDIMETAEKSAKAGKELPFKDAYFGK